MKIVLISSMLLLNSYSTFQQDIGTITEYYKLSQEDYSVYSAVINNLYVSEETRIVVIVNESRERQILRPMFHLNADYALITKQEAEDLCIKCADTKFYEKYPNSPGYIRLSGISFNSELNRAVVLIERRCGLMCAEGIYVKLLKKNGVWKVEEKELSWAE